MRKDLQNGRSMLEMLGVLAIVGVLTVGGFSLVSKVNTNNQINTVVEEISSFARKIRVVSRDYSEDSDGTFLKYICKGKAYPDTMECNLPPDNEEEDTCNCESFTGSDDVTYTADSGEYPILFTLTVSDLSEEMCMAILTSNWGSVSTTGFAGFSDIDSTDIGAASTVCDEDGKSLTLNFR